MHHMIIDPWEGWTYEALVEYEQSLHDREVAGEDTWTLREDVLQEISWRSNHGEQAAPRKEETRVTDPQGFGNTPTRSLEMQLMQRVDALKAERDRLMVVIRGLVSAVANAGAIDAVLRARIYAEAQHLCSSEQDASK